MEQPKFTKAQLSLIKHLATALRIEMEHSDTIGVNSPFYGYTKTDLMNAKRIIKKL